MNLELATLIKMIRLSLMIPGDRNWSWCFRIEDPGHEHGFLD